MLKTNKTKLLVELSGEHPKLPIAELSAILNVFSKSYNISNLDKRHRLLVIESNEDDTELLKNLGNRLAMAKNIFQLILKIPYDSFITNLEELNKQDLEPGSSFKLMTKHLIKKEKVTIKFEDKIKSSVIKKLSKVALVNVKSPDSVFILYFGHDIILAKKIISIDRGAFEKRKPQFRPYFAPISLNPRLARCLVNLSETPCQGVIIDPFCGTGGILIEAGLLRYSIIGADIDNNMVKGTKINLEYWGIKNSKTIHSDIKDLHNKLDTNLKIDSIVTEPPYGRATTTQGVTIDHLLESAFKTFYKILKRNGHLVISLPDETLARFSEEYFKVLNKFIFPVHRSLTKHIYIFERKPNSNK